MTSEIDWEEEHLLQPAEQSLRAYCQGKGISPVDGTPQHKLFVLVSEKALQSLYHFLESDLSREHGGVLVGLPYHDPQLDLSFVDIQSALPALETDGSPVHMQLTAAAWESISGNLEESFPGLAIIGWYHSHPDLGVFMSSTDAATQRAFYSQDWSLALVVDPIRQKAGWFSGPECQPMLKEQFVIYRERPVEPPSRPAQPVEQAVVVEQWRQRLYQDLSWFLPMACLVLAVLLGAWFFFRPRG